jgi:hypothetical protein
MRHPFAFVAITALTTHAAQSVMKMTLMTRDAPTWRNVHSKTLEVACPAFTTLILMKC